MAWRTEEGWSQWCPDSYQGTDRWHTWSNASKTPRREAACEKELVKKKQFKPFEKPIAKKPIADNKWIEKPVEKNNNDKKPDIGKTTAEKNNDIVASRNRLLRKAGCMTRELGASGFSFPDNNKDPWGLYSETGEASKASTPAAENNKDPRNLFPETGEASKSSQPATENNNHENPDIEKPVAENNNEKLMRLRTSLNVSFMNEVRTNWELNDCDLAARAERWQTGAAEVVTQAVTAGNTSQTPAMNDMGPIMAQPVVENNNDKKPDIEKPVTENNKEKLMVPTNEAEKHSYSLRMTCPCHGGNHHFRRSKTPVSWKAKKK
jgi:hypothetical protein